MSSRIRLAFATTLSAVAFAGTTLAGPPATDRRPVEEKIQGETFVDDYQWLEPLESESEEVRIWTDAQNAYTEEVLHGLPCRPELVDELSKLMNVPGIGTPRQAGGHLFFNERAAGADQSVLKMRPAGGTEADDRVLIDPNTLDDGGLISLDWWRPTIDGSKIAFGISREIGRASCRERVYVLV